jgi:hypothetical protein
MRRKAGRNDVACNDPPPITLVSIQPETTARRWQVGQVSIESICRCPPFEAGLNVSRAPSSISVKTSRHQHVNRGGASYP